MILVDFSQIFLSNLLVKAGNYADSVDENLVRHMILTSLKGHKKKFGREYGEMVLCCDGRNYWRKKSFPYYKYKRSSKRKESHLDWKKIYQIHDQLLEELEIYFPYPIIKLDETEADDIIGTLCIELEEKIVIISGDHDFIQLLDNKNVSLYSPRKRRFVENENPRKYLYEHIIKGDDGDGIPNIRSASNSFAEGVRQKPITEKMLNNWLDSSSLYINPDELFSDEEMKRFETNRKLIDLSEIPNEHKEEILKQYLEGRNQKKSTALIIKYFQKYKMNRLFDDINNF